MFLPWESNMYSIKTPRLIFRRQLCQFGVLLILLITINGCGGATDDLLPSSEDKRPLEITGQIGGMVGNTSPELSLTTTDNVNFTLSDYLLGGVNEAEAVVLYFTMWCPICSAHMDHIQFGIMPEFTSNQIVYLAVDYLSDSTSLTARSQQDAGFNTTKWLATADPDQTLTEIFNGTMATTVVIDPDGKVRMNEDFRTGENLQLILRELTAGP